MNKEAELARTKYIQENINPSYGLSESEALTYAGQMGASDSFRGIRQYFSGVFGFEDTLEKLKKDNKKLNAILANPEYGNKAMGVFLTSAVAFDPVGWIPIIGTAKKAKSIYQLGKYGLGSGLALGAASYVDEEAPGLIGEKQSRLENALLGGFGGTVLAPTIGAGVNLTQKLRGKEAVYGIINPIKKQTKIDSTPESKFLFSSNKETDEIINKAVEVNLNKNKNKIENPVLKFYQENVGEPIYNAVFKTAGSSFIGGSAGIATFNYLDEESPTTFKFAATAMAIIAGKNISKAVGKMNTRGMTGQDELIGDALGKLFISDYGLTDDYLKLRKKSQVLNNTIAGKFHKVAIEAKENLSPEQNKLLYNLMIGDSVEISKILKSGIKLGEEARALITKYSQDMIDLNLIDASTVKKNINKYLHRTYLSKNTAGQTNEFRTNTKVVTLIGDELRPRGDVKSKISKEDYENKFKEKGYEILEESKDGTLTIRLDYTKEERIKLGEIENASFAIAETGRLFAKDISNGKFLIDISNDKNFTLTKKDFKKLSESSASASREWRLMPKDKIAGTKKFKFGPLAGKYVRTEVHDDLVKLFKYQDSPTGIQQAFKKIDTAMRVWKKSKTAWNPTTHVNNTVSNVILLDFADTKIKYLPQAIAEMSNKNSEVLQLAKTQGIFDVDLFTKELNEISTVINKELKDITSDEIDNITNSSINVWEKLFKGTKKVFKGTKKLSTDKMEKAYQYEDQIFRMAVFLDRLDKGKNVTEAAIDARRWFIDYDINAPAVNLMRKSVTPFLSYTYRVIPLLTEAAILRPHKFAKWAAVGYGLNEIGVQFGSGDAEVEKILMSNQDKKKKFLPLVGSAFDLGPSAMIKLPFNSADGDSQYLDVSRFIPGGDVFETREDSGFKLPLLPTPAQPGGLYVDVASALYTKKSAFTGKPIDDGLDGVRKYIYRLFTPNIPVVPYTYATEKLKKAKIYEKTGKGTSQYTANYSYWEALAYGLGIKLRPQNRTATSNILRLDYEKKRKALVAKQKNIIRAEDNGQFDSEEEYKEAYKKIELQIIQLAAEYSRDVSDKLIRLGAKRVAEKEKLKKSTGGLVEGEDNVTDTEENPADRTNPYTGESYAETSKGVLATLKTRQAERKPLNRGGLLNKLKTRQRFAVGSIAAKGISTIIKMLPKKVYHGGTKQARENDLNVEGIFAASNKLHADSFASKDAIARQALTGDKLKNISKEDFDLSEINISSVKNPYVLDAPNNLIKRQIEKDLIETPNLKDSKFNALMALLNPEEYNLKVNSNNFYTIKNEAGKYLKSKGYDIVLDTDTINKGVINNPEAELFILKKFPSKKINRVEVKLDTIKTPTWFKETKVKTDVDPADAQKTQVAITSGTYKKVVPLLKEGDTLDFGAGLGKGAKILKADSYEPFPKKGFKPTFTETSSIPNSSYDNVVSLNVLNVVKPDVRNDIVLDIGRILKPEGTAIITTRGSDIFGNKNNITKGVLSNLEDGAVITSSGTYQKGFTNTELKNYVSELLGKDFKVENITGLGKAGIKVTKL